MFALSTDFGAIAVVSGTSDPSCYMASVLAQRTGLTRWKRREWMVEKLPLFGKCLKWGREHLLSEEKN